MVILGKNAATWLEDPLKFNEYSRNHNFLVLLLEILTVPAGSWSTIKMLTDRTISSSVVRTSSSMMEASPNIAAANATVDVLVKALVSKSLINIQHDYYNAYI